jgi:predicted transposase YdaD
MHRLQSPHDALFRYVFGEPRHAASLLRCALPRSVASAIDWRTLVRDETTLVDDRLRRRAADLLFAARCRRTRTRLFLLPEHLSSRDRFAALRLLGYGVRIWERCHRGHPRRRLPLLLAFVVHHGDRPFGHRPRMQTLVDLGDVHAHVDRAGQVGLADMTLVVHDLATIDERRLCNQRLTPLAGLACLFLQRLRHADDARAAAAFRHWRRLLVGVADSATGREDLAALFSWLHATTDLDLDRLRAVLAGIHPLTEHAYMTTADRLRRKGRKEGLTKGIAKGIAAGETRGQATVILRQLQERFGPLPADAVARVRSASAAELGRYAVLVLTADSLAEFFGD